MTTLSTSKLAAIIQYGNHQSGKTSVAESVAAKDAANDHDILDNGTLKPDYQLIYDRAVLDLKIGKSPEQVIAQALAPEATAKELHERAFANGTRV